MGYLNIKPEVSYNTIKTLEPKTVHGVQTAEPLKSTAVNIIRKTSTFIITIQRVMLGL